MKIYKEKADNLAMVIQYQSRIISLLNESKIEDELIGDTYIIDCEKLDHINYLFIQELKELLTDYSKKMKQQEKNTIAQYFEFLNRKT